MRRRLPLFKTVLGLSAALAAAVAAVLAFARVDRVVVAPGRLAGGSTPVRAAVDGIVAELLARAGSRVEAGAALVQLDTRELDAALASARALADQREERLANVAAEIRLLEDDLHPSEATHAERAVERAELVHESAGKRVELLRRLRDQGLVRATEVEDAAVARDLAEVAVGEAREAGALLASRHRTRLAALDGERRELELGLAEERCRIAELERRRSAATIVADRAGIVTGSDLEELPGRAVAAGEELLRIAHAMAGRFEVDVDDRGRSRARPGAPVNIRLSGYPWLLHGVLAGSVSWVSDRRGDGGGFPVRIAIDPGQSPGPLYEGMLGEARIVVEEDVSIGRILLERLLGPLQQ